MKVLRQRLPLYWGDFAITPSQILIMNHDKGVAVPSPIAKKEIQADNDAAELTAEAFVAAFKQIRDPEVRASIVALVTRLAEASNNGSKPYLQS